MPVEIEKGVRIASSHQRARHSPDASRFSSLVWDSFRAHHPSLEPCVPSRVTHLWEAVGDGCQPRTVTAT
jgi:hypothetical protein